MLDASMGVQSKNFLWVLASDGNHSQDMLSIRNVKVIYCPTNYTSMVHDLGNARCWSSFTECCLFDGPSKEHTTANKWLQAVYFTVLALLRHTYNCEMSSPVHVST